jgi:uncharacterized membrane protein
MPDASKITGNALQVARKAAPSPDRLKGPGGIATVGAALIALPYAAQGIAKLAGGGSGNGKSGGLKDAAKQKAAGKAKELAGQSLFGEDGIFSKAESDSKGDSDSDDADATEAHGSGRRMPMQQAVDVGIPLKAAYNLWTEFEEWPSFMHRVDSAQQLDDSTVSFSTKVWGITKEFEAEIVEQRPDERIEWKVSEGLAHSGVVTFHELAPRLTRIEVTLDMKPEGMVEKMGRGMRFAKRAVRGDLHRFKAYAEMEEEPEGGWRGTIEDGEVKRKTERKSGRSTSGRSRSSSRHSKNGSDPSGSSRRAGAHD